MNPVYKSLRRVHIRQMHSFKPHYGLFINGKEIESKSNSSFVIQNPATLDSLCTVSEGRKEDIDLALSAAQTSFQSGVWSKADVRDRANVLNKAATALGLIINYISYTYY